MGKERKRTEEGRYKKLSMREFMDEDKIRFYNLIADGKLYYEAVKEVYGVEERNHAGAIASRIIKDPRYQHYHRNQTRRELMRVKANGGVYLDEESVIERISTLALAGEKEATQLKALELLVRIYGMEKTGERGVPDNLKTAYAKIVEGETPGIEGKDL